MALQRIVSSTGSRRLFFASKRLGAPPSSACPAIVSRHPGFQIESRLWLRKSSVWRKRTRRYRKLEIGENGFGFESEVG